VAEGPAQAADALLRYALCRVTRPATTPRPSLTSIDWPATLDRARALNLLPVLAHACADSVDLPTDVRATLQTAARQQRVRNTLLADAFGTIAARFGAAGIDLLALKGVALAHTVYPSPTLRYFDDIDLLVRPAQATDAERLLREIGYVDHPRAERPDWHHLPPLVHPTHGATIELHVDLIRRAGHERWPLDAVWQRAVPVTIGGSRCQTPAAADALIHTALHARHHLFEKAGFLLDSALLLPRIDDWDALAALAAAAGATAPLAHLIAVATRLGLLVDAPAISARRLPRVAARRLRNWDDLTPLRPALRSGALPKLLELLLMDDGRARRQMAWALIAPRGTLVQTGYSNPADRLWRRSKMAVKQLTAILLRRDAAQ
jgi:hypothetical protein